MATLPVLSSSLPALQAATTSAMLPPASTAPLVSSAMQAMPAVASPASSSPTQLMLDTAKRDQLVNSGSGIQQIKSPILRGLATAADIAGSVFRPLHNLEYSIPGTNEHHQLLINQQNALIDKDQAQQAADTAQQDAQAQITERAAKAAKENAQADAAANVPDKPESVQQLYAGAIQDAQRRGVDPATDPKVMQLADAQTSLQKPPTVSAGEQPLSADEARRLNGVWDPIATKHHLPQGQFDAGMSHTDATQLASGLNGAIGKQQGDTHIVIQQQGQAAAAERAKALASSKNGEVDVTSPDAVASLTAVAHGAAPITTLLPRGATTQQRQKVLASLLQINPNFNSGLATAISGTENDAAHGAMAKNMTAIRTANDHLTQLGAAATALKNGDVQTLNRIGNAYNVEMGGSAPTNFSTVKNAVAGELAKALTGTATVDEIHQMNSDINSAQSPQQIQGVVKTYQSLMQSKAKEQQKQYESGKGGTPDFSLGNGGNTGPKAGDVEGGYRFKGGNPASQTSWEKVK